MENENCGECQICGKPFEVVIYIDEEPRCPYCYSGDIILYQENEDE